MTKLYLCTPISKFSKPLFITSPSHLKALINSSIINRKNFTSPLPSQNSPNPFHAYPLPSQCSHQLLYYQQKKHYLSTPNQTCLFSSSDGECGTPKQEFARKQREDGKRSSFSVSLNLQVGLVPVWWGDSLEGPASRCSDGLGHSPAGPSVGQLGCCALCSPSSPLGLEEHGGAARSRDNLALYCDLTFTF